MYLQVRNFVQILLCEKILYKDFLLFFSLQSFWHLNPNPKVSGNNERSDADICILEMPQNRVFQDQNDQKHTNKSAKEWNKFIQIELISFEVYRQ